MSQTVLITQSDYKNLIERITALEQMVRNLAKTVMSTNPMLKKEEWWIRDVAESRRDIALGKFVTLKTAKDIDRHFDKLDEIA